MINVHLQCGRLPKGSRAVLCHGSNDAVFQRTRRSLEELVTDPRHQLLYYSGDSGPTSGGRLIRRGDGHEMESIVQHDLLNRLIDAATGFASGEISRA
eukprot:CAMPEP_0168486600 /NCGR_PEP_ID=MMETSP0228-20121227/67203_1 /TAXON_ID=133427 /ORGANISM="Protoceratium reticulatum, Strain CCCM 535 (=CCMP 1889)" /LENGTH=97 /DNA_ID=CAMNT_0008503189 /DNA_START=12 /DNA_END=301 /DNA_ORIENTATION=-